MFILNSFLCVLIIPSICLDFPLQNTLSLCEFNENPEQDGDISFSPGRAEWREQHVELCFHWVSPTATRGHWIPSWLSGRWIYSIKCFQEAEEELVVDLCSCLLASLRRLKHSTLSRGGFWAEGPWLLHSLFLAAWQSPSLATFASEMQQASLSSAIALSLWF